MKLHFTKANGDVSISIIDGEAEISFKYTDLIRKLYDERKIEESVFTGEFTDEEKGCINALINEITDGLIEKQDAPEGDGFMAVPVF